MNNITGHNAEPCRLCSTMGDTILYWKQSYSLFINLALYLTVKTSKIDFLIVILHHVGLTGKGVVKNTKCITTNESLAIKINSKHESHQKSLALMITSRNHDRGVCIHVNPFFIMVWFADILLILLGQQQIF